MFSIRKLALIPALALAAACGRDESKQDVDAALANDLSLAGQAQPAQQFVSPTELGADSLRYAPAPAPALVEAPAPARASSARGTSTRRVASSSTTRRRRTTSTPRSTSTTSTASSEGSSSGVYDAPAPAPVPTTRTEEVKHTKRDAVIGAVAGGAIGAATSRDKIKGAVIGAAAGGVLGAIIGNKVDKSTRTVPQF
ncbi:MAG: YMGG-like glycine zipper-containing protein [Gemmatimonadaceae bacterium]